jgi:hypothetical protein
MSVIAPDQIPVDSVSNRLRYGVAIFDDASQAQGGWCAVEGKIKRISAPSDLLGDTIWWTNIGFEDYKKAGLFRNPWTRRSDYPRVTHDVALTEWNFPENATPQTKAAFLAETFERIIAVAKRFGVEDISSFSLEASFAKAFFRPGRNDFPVGRCIEALQQTIQSYSSVPLRPDRSKIVLSLRKPRLSYAAKLLEMPYPVGPFGFTKATDFPEGVNRLKYLKGEGKPFFARISLDKPRQKYADVMAYGVTMKESITRSWAAQPEIELLDTIAEITIHDAWVASAANTQPIPAAMEAALQFPIANASWSMGVVGDNICRALMAKSQPPGGDPATHSYRAAWLRSYDRTFMLRDAMKLVDAGFTVTGYANGTVAVRLSPEEAPALMKAAFALGLVPSLGYVKECAPVQLPAGAWGGLPEDEMLAICTLENNRDALLALDRLALLDEAGQMDGLEKLFGG